MPKPTPFELHDFLFRWLISRNFPDRRVPKERKVWFREVAVGFSEAGIEKPDLRASLEKAMGGIEEPAIRRIAKLQTELGLVDYDLYNRLAKGGYSLVQSADYVCVIGDLEEGEVERTWILEGKREPDHTSIGQVLVYEDLFRRDYPHLGETRKGIVCLEGHPLNEPACRKLRIELLIVDEEERLRRSTDEAVRRYRESIHRDLEAGEEGF